MHAAKGLEFPFIYIVGVEEGLIPYKRSVEEDNLDEEKRLFYVAMTRAEEELQLIYAQKRFDKDRKPSRFIKDLNSEKIDSIEDEEIIRIKKKLEKSKKKQLGLF
jgi:superfamily I DNA/RNA helicase